jgi:hypothetical protein
VHTYGGDLVVRLTPGGAGPASFSLYDGTQLTWTGTVLQVSGNPRPRTVELRLPDGSAYSQALSGAEATIGPG